MQFFDNSGNNYSTNKDNNENININEEDNDVIVNKQNSEYYDRLMKENSGNKDAFYDKNNWVVKVILFILGIIIIVGTIFIFGRGM